VNNNIVIAGTGVYVPPHKISNEELVNSFNAFVDIYNQQHPETPRPYSSASFIEKASGIQNRYVIDKEGILDPARMYPKIALRQDDEPSLQAEIACIAIQAALQDAKKTPADIDGIILACSFLQRSYPAVAIEVQHLLGAKGFAFDMNVACSSSTFGIATAYNYLLNEQNKCMVVVNPEITTGHIDFQDRDSHFIFGDISIATVLERNPPAPSGFEILGHKLSTSFSNNIRNNNGFLNRAECDNACPLPLHLFKQNGRKVFKEVVTLVEEHITAHLASLKLTAHDIKRFWLHQANINMNELIIKKILNHDPLPLHAPMILHEYGNIASAGSLMAFHHHRADLQSGDLGLICSFGAGYSIGSLIVKKC